MYLQLLQTLGWALLNSLWQMALLWVAYQALSLFLHKAKATQRATLASALLLTGFGWFVSTFVVVYFNISAGHTISSPLAALMYNDWLPQSLPWISGIYLLLLIIPVLRFIRNYRYVQVIRTYGLSKIQVDWRMYIQQHSELMGIRKKVKIWVSDFVASPVTVGFLKPMILVPAAAINHLTPQQLEAVLLHELAHIRRYDYLLNLLVNIIKTILYFNPFVKALVKVLEREREKSCDELVLQFRYNPFQYATALLTLEQTVRQPEALIMQAGGKKGDLLHRIENIMGVQQKPGVSPHKIFSLLSVIICILSLNLVLLIPGSSTGKKALTAYSSYVSPLDLAAYNGDEYSNDGLILSEQPLATISNFKSAPAAMTSPMEPAAPETPAPVENTDNGIVSMAYRLAGLQEVQSPELKKYQEAQVQKAMAESRRVLENIQWKEVEKSIADAFSEKEKKEIKTVYEKELSKFNWDKWENNLKQAYAQIDWDNVNIQLNSALNQIRIDSLQRVYNDVAVRLNEVQKELIANKVKAIPDTDITLRTVEDKKEKVQESLRKLRAIRSKKIVSL